MPATAAPRRVHWLPVGVGTAALVILIGVVMAETHVPTAIPADHVPKGGAQVATFALG